MTCEEFLMQYRKSMAEVDEMDDQIKLAEERLQRVTAKYDGVKVQSSNDRRNAEAELADLVRAKGAALEAAEQKRQEILAFISKVGAGSGDTGRRHRRILKLYYCDALQWSDICAAIRPLRVRRDGRQVTYKKRRGISETTLFRVRLEALAAADIEFRRLGLG
jgi:hypothetical protein